ncbi:MAG: thioredoxin domain-containing protein [Spirochaetales bacterium]
MRFDKNNLNLASSPYLLQHVDNPVWWQEWTQETLDYAREAGKPLFVSVGYSTCHWCHVMAADAFSDEACAAYLNEHFISIKLDREERPDIDHFLMTFLVATTGQGGWPLNAFLVDRERPFFAMTYAASSPKFGRPGFPEILERIRSFYEEKRDQVEPFTIPADRSASRLVTPVPGTETKADEILGEPTSREEDDATIADLIRKLARRHDERHGGFGAGAKFPPHTPLFFLTHASAAGFADAAPLATGTLDAMMRRGLHDHLQGGFYRYTVDQEWEIPHFEKMLYDQAMVLWNYSLAARQFNRSEYRAVAHDVLRCLEQTFAIDGLYASGHDADTEHEEGATYLWSEDELQEVFTDDEFALFSANYAVSARGNFEGKNHLVRRADSPYPSSPQLREIEQRLLVERNRRPQPSRDAKIISGWNALAAAGLFAAGRFAAVEQASARAIEITDLLLDRFVRDGQVGHSYLPGGGGETAAATTPPRSAKPAPVTPDNRFLADHAAMLYLLTVASEESPEHQERYAEAREELAAGLAAFYREGVWMENVTADFHPIPADPYDQPAPSGVALAQAALLRRAMQRQEEHGVLEFGDAQGEAFFNTAALASRGLSFAVETPKPYSWNQVPVNSVVFFGQGRTTCYRGVCYLGSPENVAAQMGARDTI